ncbi:E3 ubiquitin-protein ligase RNF180 [Osmerus mordax]|uniref:E3 ubiquitin-protein ligase RNF180 n=1 Tax=Osmerus mordax TaxID=8014 RepID=UPI00350EA7B9
MESPGNVAMLRCRKCRKSYIDSTCLYPIATDYSMEATCSVWHVNVEMLPEWILTSVCQAHWTVGRLNCQSCGARLGGFNFINQTKCPCGQEITVHLNKSRVDHDHKHSLHMARTRTARVGGGWGCPQAEPGGSHSQPSSQFCCASFPRLNLESRPITTHLNALDQLTDSQVAPSVNPSDPFTLPLKKGFFSNVRSRSELETSSSTLGLSQSSPMDNIEGQLRCWREQSPHSSQVTNTTQLLDIVDRPANAPRLLPVSRERRPALHTEEPQTCAQPRASGPTPERAAPLPEAPGSPPVSPRGAVVGHPSMERQREREEEEAREVWGSSTELQAQRPPVSTASPGPTRLSKREKNRLKSQRRKQRRRERWIHSQLEKDQSVSGVLTDSEEGDREGYTCAVCLDVYYSPFSCHPCGHVFCEPCLRTLAKNRPASTPCPLCRTLITHTLFQKELNQSAKTFFPKVYHTRKQNFQKATCAKWPLPNCRKRFRIFWGYQRQAVADRRWHFAPAGFTLDALDLADMRGWLFDIDLVIIYIHSVNWILALLILGFLAYFFFS